ncbi:hypothetical protein BH683_003310 [Williamsia sp. 1138]|uniref:DUF6319 family protein n=1 Tax=Williamsia sp. 1138 TaxID=1903117 RepID=UPI000A11FCED|nr:DUF6319 family protein [Williamsia sp. 1138]OZG30555.1 hypothetical protein BH683_003310 [Williamsia sp. 1138]
MVSVNSRKRTGLTTDELESMSTALAAGKRVTVYLRDPMPSLDLPAGASARVVSIDGSTVMVSPKGVDDQLPFEADELQKTRTPATPAAPARQRPVKATAASTTTRPPSTVLTPTKPSPEPVLPAPVEAKVTTPKAPRRTKTPTTTAAVSVTITSLGESTWSVAVSHGNKRQGKPAEVTSDRVARAMHTLGDDTAITAVDAVIESARAATQKRIDELTSELEAARAVLAHLDEQAEG